MQPNHNNFTPPSELPQPQEAGGFDAVGNSPITSPEVAISSLPQPLQATTPALAPIPAATQLASVNDALANGIVGASTVTLMADDSDLIEKEWVAKAKNIVMQTKNDPHQQTQKMGVVKADYLKKRYNKELKVNEK